MDLSPDVAQNQQASAQAPTLKVDFLWKGFKTLITENNEPSSHPIYTVDMKTLKPHLVFKSATDKTIGTGTLYAFSINASCEINGQPVKLKALKRFKTEYTYLSYAFAANKESPVTMAWTGTMNFKTWDFVCLDEQQMPVAKFSANMWALKKVGKIEFLSKATSDAMRDEIVVTGLTLLYCMLLRCNSLPAFFTAIFSRPRHDRDAVSKS